MKISKAAIKQLPQARHCAVESNVVHFKAAKDAFGEEIVVVFDGSERSNMSMRRFKEIYIVL